MTGFARESAETDIGTLTWEIRAVNHRYLDIQFKLPDDLRPREQAFRQRASALLGRGKIERQGKRIAFLSFGCLLQEALAAGDLAQDER